MGVKMTRKNTIDAATKIDEDGDLDGRTESAESEALILETQSD